MMETRRILLVVMSAVVAYVQGKDVCSPMYPVNTGHYCFKYIRERKTYSEATTLCSKMGGVVAHPAAQDWGTWKQDVQAVTRNDHSLWVGTTRNKSSWYWLSTRYDGQDIPIDNNLKKQGDISIPKSAWSSKANYKCLPKKINGTIVNETLANSTSAEGNSTDELICHNDTAHCAVFGKDGKLKDRDCGHSAHYVLCQGPIDYSSSCDEGHNCTDNAYNLPISFTVCGCKCKDDYIGDGYNYCKLWINNIGIPLPLAIFGIVVGALISFTCCVIGVRKQMNTKSTAKKAVKKTWSIPAMGFFFGLLIIIVCL